MDDLPYGPWKDIFSGKWSGYPVRVMENPDKHTLTLIVDEQAGKMQGTLVLLHKFFVVEGDSTRLADNLGAHSMILEKHYPSFKVNYFSISPGPSYVKAEEDLKSEIMHIYEKIDKLSASAMEMSRGYGLEMTELKYAQEDYAAQLFSEPFLLPAMIIRKAGESAVGPAANIKAVNKVLLGNKLTGEKAEENIQSFANTLIVGPLASLKNSIQVLVENCVLNGITAIVFDEDNSYKNMGVPNKNFDFEHFPDLQPIGMPVKNVELPKVAIDLNIITSKEFRELIELPARDGEYAGKVAMEMIDQALDEHTTQLTSLKDIEERLLSFRDEIKKYNMYQAVRMVRVLHRAYPDYFDGKMDPSLLISPYLRSIGSIVRIDLSPVPEHLKKAFIYSIMKSLYLRNKAELSSKELKVIAFIVRGSKYAPQKAKTVIEEGLSALLTDCNNFGIGFCLGTEHDVDMNFELTKNATVRLDFIGEKEAAVKETNSRPYRMTLRPNLSA